MASSVESSPGSVAEEPLTTAELPSTTASCPTGAGPPMTALNWNATGPPGPQGPPGPTGAGGGGLSDFGYGIVDPGLANWAGQYLNERVAGLELGSHALRRRLEDSSLGPRENAFLQSVQTLLSSSHLAVTNEGHAKHVGDCAIGAVFLFERRQQLDHLFILAQP